MPAGSGARSALRSSLYEKPTRALFRDAFTEFLATALFLFVTISTIASSCTTSDTMVKGTCEMTIPRLVLIASTFGGSIAALVYAAAPVSGGHLNVCVTAAFALRRKITLSRAVIYILAQLAGAMFGTLLARGVNPGAFDRVGGGANSIADGYNWLHAWLLELVTTFILIFVVFVATDQQRASTPHVPVLAPFAIGLAVLLAHFVSIPYDGCSINPSRSFGSAVVAHQWHHHYVFWLGPFSGAVLAVIIYEGIFVTRTTVVTVTDDRNIARLGTFTGVSGLDEELKSQVTVPQPRDNTGL